MDNETAKFTYYAFISYKRGGEDEKYARWLQRKLESYRLPIDLTGGGLTGKSRRLKIFRDKTDLGSHYRLDQGLSESLNRCRYLIVVCSPRSAESAYVADEVRYFQDNGRSSQIIPFIIEGTPVPKNSTEKNCYPETLSSDFLGVTLAEGTKEEALIKILARLLQVDYAHLYQRHLRMQRKFLGRILSGTLAVLLIVAALATWAVSAEQRATVQRKEAENLVKFLTFDLRNEALDYIPLKAREKISGRVDAYFSRWGIDSIVAKYIKLGSLLNQIETTTLKGKGEHVKAISEARALIAELRQIEPDDADMLLSIDISLANIEARDIIFSGKNYQAALEYIQNYWPQAKDLAERYPDTPMYLTCWANAEFILATVLHKQGKDQEADGHYRKRLEISRQVVDLAPYNEDYVGDLCDALTSECNRLVAIGDREAEVICDGALALAQDRLLKDRGNLQRREDAALAYRILAFAKYEFGKIDEAEKFIGEAVTMARELTEQDPGNQNYKELLRICLNLQSFFDEDEDRSTP